MIIVVDGYNVLKREIPSINVSYQQRVQFLAKLSRYNQQKGHEIIVVFDGGESSWPSVMQQKHVTVVYSGKQRTADDYIKDYIIRNAHKDLLLVSSDRELNIIADHYDIPSIDSDFFYAKVNQAAKEVPLTTIRQEKLTKISSVHNAELDEIMRQGSEHIENKSEDHIIGQIEIIELKTGSKKEKKLFRIAKKL